MFNQLFRDVQFGVISMLLASVGGCLTGGCSQYQWSTEKAKGNLNMGTQLHVEFGTKIAVGFPGRLYVESEVEASGGGTFEAPEPEAAGTPGG